MSKTIEQFNKDMGLDELRVINVAQRRKIARRMARLAKSSAFKKKKSGSFNWCSWLYGSEFKR